VKKERASASCATAQEFLENKKSKAKTSGTLLKVEWKHNEFFMLLSK
jgi:hypothetical protein